MGLSVVRCIVFQQVNIMSLLFLPFRKPLVAQSHCLRYFSVNLVVFKLLRTKMQKGFHGKLNYIYFIILIIRKKIELGSPHIGPAATTIFSDMSAHTLHTAFLFSTSFHTLTFLPHVFPFRPQAPIEDMPLPLL